MAETALNPDELKIRTAIEKGEYEKARKFLSDPDNRLNPVVQSIFGASIALALGEEQLAWQEIETGLRVDSRNYELYLLLGEYYATKNLRQTYLCYENALFFCDNKEDQEQIQLMLDHLQELGVFVPKAAIVILSYNLLDMTRECIESIRDTTPESAREIIVVDNASTDGSVEWLKTQDDIKLACNTKNQGFPRGCNQGIALAEKTSDVFLLNNDTVMTGNALFWLRMGLYEDERNGSVGSVSNYVSNHQAVIENGKTKQEYLAVAEKINVPMRFAYLNKVYLVGFAILINRTVLDAIGLLDERFSPGNYEDNDICLRISLAGYRNVLCKNSFLIHWGSQSFGRQLQKFNDLMQENQNRFFEKWSLIGLHPEVYWNLRADIAGLLERQKVTDEKIMVVGTGCGSCLSYLQDKFPLAQLYGMEQREHMAKIADGIADTVCVNLDEWKSDELEEVFDIIIINDTLESTENPERVLAELARMLKREGKIFLSFANSTHFSRIGRQLGERKLFSRRQMEQMISKAKLSGSRWAYTQVENSLPDLQEQIQRLTGQFPAVDEEELRAYQWIVTLEKQRTDLQFGNRMALYIITYNHPDTVDNVLSHCAEVYKRYALDVYYYDSSETEQTKRIIEKYQSLGYDNLHYSACTSDTLSVTKQEYMFSLKWDTKGYGYLWCMKDRCWCEEKTLRLICQGLESNADIVFMDVGHPDCAQELSRCDDIDYFYHRCGDYATSMDATIYNINTMLKNKLNIKEMRQKYKEAWRNFIQFAITFEQLSKIENPSICLLAGENVEIYNSRTARSGWLDQRIEIWGKSWIKANEMLPACYTQRDEIIKRTASFPWILGDVNILTDMQQRGILTPEKYEEIKVFWERVSTIPLEVVRLIANGEYDEYFEPLRLEIGSSENLNIFVQIYKAVLDGRMQLQKVPLKEMQNTVVQLLMTRKEEQSGISVIRASMNGMQNQLLGNELDLFAVLAQLQVYISFLLLMEK